MARIAYDGDDAAAFAATRHLTDDGLASWQAAIACYLALRPGMRLLDLGSDAWAQAFASWYDGLDVVAVEPSEAMRARSWHPVMAGDAEHIPLDDSSIDAVWLSTVIHHIPDLTAAVREIRRVLRLGGVVGVRRTARVDHAVPLLPRSDPGPGQLPSVADVENVFFTIGFITIGLEPVPQLTAASLREAAAALRRDAHTPLQLITDDEYTAGLTRLRRAAKTATEPVIDALDLLVLQG